MICKNNITKRNKQDIVKFLTDGNNIGNCKNFKGGHRTIKKVIENIGKIRTRKKQAGITNVTKRDMKKITRVMSK